MIKWTLLNDKLANLAIEKHVQNLKQKFNRHGFHERKM